MRIQKLLRNKVAGLGKNNLHAQYDYIIKMIMKLLLQYYDCYYNNFKSEQTEVLKGDDDPKSHVIF